jgi:DNA-binding response OmpR family regulator
MQAKGTILIAEDQLDIRENLVEFLTMEGYQVLQAADGKEAYCLALTKRPDLIISDMAMPTWDGMRLLGELRENSTLADIPVIILTAWADQDFKREALTDGAADYLTKPFSLEQIKGICQCYLSPKRGRDES